MMYSKNTRWGFTQAVQARGNMFFTSPLEGEGGQWPDEGESKIKTSFMNIKRHPLTCPTGHPLPQGARGTARGFTLIELLVVVLIIGILAAVALPQYQKAVEKSRAAEAKTVINSFQKGIDLWLLENTIPEQGVTFTGEDDHDPALGGSGMENNMQSASLDIGELCSVSNRRCDIEGTSYCSTRDFAYWAACFANSCYIYAMRVSPELREWGLSSDPGEDQAYFMISPNAVEGRYTLSSTKNLTTGKWSNYCDGSLCSSLNW